MYQVYGPACDTLDTHRAFLVPNLAAFQGTCFDFCDVFMTVCQREVKFVLDLTDFKRYFICDARTIAIASGCVGTNLV